METGVVCPGCTWTPGWESLARSAGEDGSSRIKKGGFDGFDSAGFGGWLPVIKSGFEALGADHVCFATDYPYELGKVPHVKKLLSEIDKLTLSAEDKKKFFGGNVRKAFGI